MPVYGVDAESKKDNEEIEIKSRKRLQDHTPKPASKRSHVAISDQPSPVATPAAAATPTSTQQRSPLASPLQHTSNLGVASPLTPTPSNRFSTLRYVAVIKDENGSLQMPPHFIVTGHPDGLLDMPLADVPATHKHVAITLAVREGKLSEADKATLYSLWSQSNSGTSS